MKTEFQLLDEDDDILLIKACMTSWHIFVTIFIWRTDIFDCVDDTANTSQQFKV